METEQATINLGDIVTINTCPGNPDCYFTGKLVTRDALMEFEATIKKHPEWNRPSGNLLGPELGIIITQTNCPDTHPTDKDLRYCSFDEIKSVWI